MYSPLKKRILALKDPPLMLAMDPITHSDAICSSLSGLESFDLDVSEMDKSCLHSFGAENDIDNIALGFRHKQ